MENRSLFLKSLKKKSDFARLRSMGRVLFPTSWLLVSYLLEIADENDRGIKKKDGLDSASGFEVLYGVTIGGKVVRSAVVRNRLRRWCRVLIRDFFIDDGVNRKNPFSDLVSSDFSGVLHINFVFLRKGVDNSTFLKGISFSDFRIPFRKSLSKIFNYSEVKKSKERKGEYTF